MYIVLNLKTYIWYMMICYSNSKYWKKSCRKITDQICYMYGFLIYFHTRCVLSDLFNCIHKKHQTIEIHCFSKFFFCLFFLFLFPFPHWHDWWLHWCTKMIHCCASLCLSFTCTAKWNTKGSGYVHILVSKHSLLHDVLRSGWGMRVCAHADSLKPFTL